MTCVQTVVTSCVCVCVYIYRNLLLLFLLGLTHKCNVCMCAYVCVRACMHVYMHCCGVTECYNMNNVSYYDIMIVVIYFWIVCFIEILLWHWKYHVCRPRPRLDTG